MKNVSLLIVMLCTIMLFSCSKKAQEQKKQEEIPFVSNTKKNLYKWIDENAINPEDFKVSNLKIAWATDSLCVINFRAIGENGFGGHIKKECQYFNVKIDGYTYEWFDDDRKINDVLHGVGINGQLKQEMLINMKDKTYIRLSKNQYYAGRVFTNAYILASQIGIGEHGNIIQ